MHTHIDRQANGEFTLHYILIIAINYDYRAYYIHSFTQNTLTYITFILTFFFFSNRPEELRQLKILLTSVLMEELKYIPVPKIEGSTDTYDFLLQNVMFYGYDLIPDHVLIKFESQLVRIIKKCVYVFLLQSCL